jgi:hypothetical protein
MKMKTIAHLTSALKATMSPSKSKINMWAIAALAMLVSSEAQAAAVIYEPFADSEATLTGNTPGTGLTGTYGAVGTSWAVASPSLAYGAIPTSGNRARKTTTAGTQWANYITTGTVADNTLKNAGLLNHGATVWFSFLFKMDDTAVSNGDAGFALGGSYVSGANAIPMQNSASGIGVSMNSNSGNLSASYWPGAGAARVSSAVVTWSTRTAPKLMVGKIVWGGDATQPDKIYIYTPATDLALPASVASISAVLDQSQFNTISFGTKEGAPEIE